MNPHIQKLYEQSWVEGSYQEPITNDDVGVFGNEQRYRTVKTSHFHLEHFAMLIVKKCALLCVHNEDMDLIEKHFGVDN